MLKKILVANRGEIALRIIRACGELGVEAVAVYSEADADSPHLDKANQKICVGPPRSSESYLAMETIIQAALQTECCAVHPGYGFLAENALFAQLCADAKLIFIGPSPAAIHLMGDKATARETMREAGLPVIPGSRGTLSDPEEAMRLAGEIGYPVILKATAGGGGRGMRLVESASQLPEHFKQASMEADKAFGNPGLYVEKYIIDGRHIEFQIIADAFGNVVHLGERECSAQRRHQKLVEEAPSPVVDRALRDDLGKKVCDAVRSIGYTNAGTVEFFRDQGGKLYFMEMNARLQVEHPVSEMITGVDLVSEQIRVAANMPLSFTQDDIVLSGHSMECRINAEDPFNDFKPDPGEVSVFEPPAGGGDIEIRVDTHVESGYRIPLYYDSMIAKLIVRAADRSSAIAGMLSALNDFSISGVQTTIGVHKRILADEGFRAGDYDTGFMERLLRGGGDG